MTQTLSEWIVIASGWALYDDAPDRVVGLERSLEVLTRWLNTPSAVDRGATGHDMVDFLDGYVCLHGEDVAAGPINDEVIGTRRFPYDMSPSCPEARHAALSVSRPAIARLASRGGPPTCVGKPGRPLLDVPLTFRPDGIFRGDLARTHAGELVREVLIPIVVER